MTRFASTLVGLAAVAAVTLSADVAAAGPWVPAPGESYAKLSGSHFDATGVFDLEGNETDPNYDYSQYAVRFYGDVGIAPHVGLSASLPFIVGKNRRQTEDGLARYVKRGFGDLDVELRAGEVFGPVALSLAAKVRIPLYDETISADSPNPIAYSPSELAKKRYLPALGDGSVDLTPTLKAGVSLHPVPAWLTASVGPKFRFQGFGNGLEYGVSGGAFLIPERLALQARAGGLQRFSSDNRRPTKSYFEVGGGPIVRLAGPVSFEATASFIPLGAFVSSGWSVSAGVSYDGRLFPNPFGSSDKHAEKTSDD